MRDFHTGIATAARFDSSVTHQRGAGERQGALRARETRTSGSGAGPRTIEGRTRMFSVSEYLSRIERAHLDILEGMEPINRSITLWWGLDGLQLNEDGTTKWVSRKRKPVETVFCQTCQSVRPIQTGLQQAGWTVQTQMAQNAALQMQSLQNMKIANTLQQCCVQYTAQYPPYYYGGCCARNIEGVILDRFY